jgi:hypothetical protein
VLVDNEMTDTDGIDCEEASYDANVVTPNVGIPNVV